MDHEMQHNDSPTWCVHCGTFDVYCAGHKCTEGRTRQFDSSIKTNAVRMFGSIFGFGTAHPQAPALPEPLMSKIEKGEL